MDLTTKYNLRTIENEDLELIRKWRNEQTDILRQVKPISYNEQKDYFSNIHKDPKQILFALTANDVFVGYCGLVNINYIYSTAEVSFIAKTGWESERTLKYKDLFTFTLDSLSEYAFNTLNLNRIWVETYEFRKKHINILENFGFIQEGVLREHVYIKGKKHNCIIHSVLKNEYL